MKFLLYWHPALSISFLCVFTLFFSYLGLKLTRKKFTEELLRSNHEVGGFIFNAFGLIYAVLVAFVVYVTWTEYDDSKKNFEAEINDLMNLRLDVEVYPLEVKSKIILGIKNYANDLITLEWDAMNKGQVSDETHKSYHRLRAIYTDINLSEIKNTQVYGESLKHINHLGERRRDRIFSLMDTIPQIIWAVLVFCGIISICYTFFFYTKKFYAQFIMTAGLTITNTFILYMIYVLDHPFTGYSRIEPDALRFLLSYL